MACQFSVSFHAVNIESTMTLESVGNDSNLVLDLMEFVTIMRSDGTMGDKKY